MAPRTRYAIDPSLTGRPLAPAPQQQQWQQPEYIQAAPPGYQPERYQQQAHLDPNSIPQLHNVPEKDILPSGPYAPTQSNYPAIHPSQQLQPKQQQEMQSPRATPPPNHIPQPPHSSGPTMSGMRVRIDPSQVPNPIEAQELDQNLYEDEDFLSCQTRGLIPLVGTDYRGVDQGMFVSSSAKVYQLMSRPRQFAASSSSSYASMHSVKWSASRHYCSSFRCPGSTFCTVAIRRGPCSMRFQLGFRAKRFRSPGV